MSGQKLNMLAHQLQSLRGDIGQIVLDAIGEQKGLGANEAAPMVAEARDFALEVKLRPILNRLALVRRELLTVGAGLDMRERIAHRVPRHLRYRERQSIGGSRQHQQSVFALLTAILDDLEALWGGRGPSEREVMDAVADAVGQGIEFAQKLSSTATQFKAMVVNGTGPELRAAPPPATNISWDVMVLLAWLLTFMLLRRSGARR